MRGYFPLDTIPVSSSPTDDAAFEDPALVKTNSFSAPHFLQLVCDNNDAEETLPAATKKLLHVLICKIFSMHVVALLSKNKSENFQD